MTENAKKGDSTSDKIKELKDAIDSRFTVLDSTMALNREMSSAIQRQNDSLDKQIQFRWTFLVFVSGFLPLLFGIAFAYQIFNVSEVRKLQDTLQKKNEEIEKTTEAYFQVIGRLAAGNELLTQGAREFQRDGYYDAASLSLRAIEQLDAASELSGLSAELSQVPEILLDTCLPKDAKKTSPADDRAAFAPRHLRQSVVNALFNAHDLRARAIFASDTRHMTLLSDQGSILVGLDPKRWEGYHWIGLARDAQETKDEHERSTLRKGAIKCFEKSIAQYQNHNKDLINMSELSVAEGRYEDGRNYAREFLFPDQLDQKRYSVFIKSPVDSIAYFYLLASDICRKVIRNREALSSEDEDNVKAFNQQFGALRLNLKGTFRFSTLDRTFDDPNLTSIKPLMSMYDCLKNLKCKEKQQ